MARWQLTTTALRGASFTDADFTGANFRDCDLRQVKITDSRLVDVSVPGLVGNFVANDVDLPAFVEGELDRRHPERVPLRAMQTADDNRAMRTRSSACGRTPSPAPHGHPNLLFTCESTTKWSFVETLRHLAGCPGKCRSLTGHRGELL